MMLITPEIHRLARQTLASIPRRRPGPVEWAEANVRLPGSARSERFDCSITPWIREPLERINDPITRTITFVKPVQSGGSTIGEVAMLYWIEHSRGLLQYNWEDDDKARKRWDSRLNQILDACKPIRARREALARFKDSKCSIDFGGIFLMVQGAWMPDNLDSDSIRLQINEELHNWRPGHLAKAYKRTTAFWDYTIINISNSGNVGDQLHQALQDGTMQSWEVRCPGCGLYHAMRTEWDDTKPELGGLRYDADGCRREGGRYDYNKLESTIRFQMPCGVQIGDVTTERRSLSLSGRYSEPANPGAHLSNRSYTLEAVSVDYIPWVKLIQEKHSALRALKYGDPGPWRVYLTERENRFWNPEDRPLVGKISLNAALKKDRDGLSKQPNFFARFFALDRQQGSLAKGELPHWWLVIRDALSTGDSQLVFEGRIETDENVVDILDRHECIRRCGVADSGDDTTHVYQFCLRHGINAIKGGTEPWYSHGEEGRKIFSPEKPLHLMLNAPPVFDYQRIGTEAIPHQDEPLFWLYSKMGIRDRLHWLRAGGGVKWDVPSDISDDYRRHMESEELEEQRSGRSDEVIKVWVQRRERNDLFVDECYIAMLMEMAGLIGAAGEIETIREKVRALTRKGQAA